MGARGRERGPQQALWSGHGKQETSKKPEETTQKQQNRKKETRIELFVWFPIKIGAVECVCVCVLKWARNGRYLLETIELLTIPFGRSDTIWMTVVFFGSLSLHRVDFRFFSLSIFFARFCMPNGNKTNAVMPIKRSKKQHRNTNHPANSCDAQSLDKSISGNEW